MPSKTTNDNDHIAMAITLIRNKLSERKEYLEHGSVLDYDYTEAAGINSDLAMINRILNCAIKLKDGVLDTRI